MGAPHSLQISSLGRSGTLSLRTDFEKSQVSLYLLHAMNGPNRPLRTSSGLPHLGHFSSCNLDRSCTSLMIWGMSMAASAWEKGPQKSPNTCCHPASPSSTLSSSVSICAVNPTLNTSGRQRFITFHTISPCGVGWKRRSLAVAYQRVRSVEMMAAYVEGRPIPRRSSSFTRLASLKRGGGSVKCWLGTICLTVTASPCASGGDGGGAARGLPSPGSLPFSGSKLLSSK